jgi:hypothetical protein
LGKVTEGKPAGKGGSNRQKAIEENRVDECRPNILSISSFKYFGISIVQVDGG